MVVTLATVVMDAKIEGGEERPVFVCVCCCMPQRVQCTDDDAFIVVATVIVIVLIYTYPLCRELNRQVNSLDGGRAVWFYEAKG